MFQTILWYISGWIYLAFTLFALLWVKILEKYGKPRDSNAYADYYSMKLARILFYLTGSTLEMKGIENIPEGAVLFVSNHPSHMDSAIIHGFIDRPKGFIADKEAMNIPIICSWMKYMKCIFIDRENVRSNIPSIEKGIQFLKNGHSMVIYPEGRINAEDHLIEFRKGCMKLAIKANVPIVPLTMVGTARIMNRNGSKIQSAHVRCIISEPIRIPELEDRNEKMLIEKVREIIANNLL